MEMIYTQPKIYRVEVGVAGAAGTVYNFTFLANAEHTVDAMDMVLTGVFVRSLSSEVCRVTARQQGHGKLAKPYINTGVVRSMVAT
jgi:hypothetical protein